MHLGTNSLPKDITYNCFQRALETMVDKECFFRHGRESRVSSGVKVNLPVIVGYEFLHIRIYGSEDGLATAGWAAIIVFVGIGYNDGNQCVLAVVNSRPWVPSEASTAAHQSAVDDEDTTHIIVQIL